MDPILHPKPDPVQVFYTIVLPKLKRLPDKVDDAEIRWEKWMLEHFHWLIYILILMFVGMHGIMSLKMIIILKSLENEIVTAFALGILSTATSWYNYWLYKMYYDRLVFSGSNIIGKTLGQPYSPYDTSPENRKIE